MHQRIHDKYLPFTPSELKKHFTANRERRIDYFQRSARKYTDFRAEDGCRDGVSLRAARTACQIEKDETFWTATALKRLIEAPGALDALRSLLVAAYGDVPPLSDLDDWDRCLDGQLHLFLEAPLRSSESYVSWLHENRNSRHLIPYVIRAGNRDAKLRLEGRTSVDAIILNASNGFTLAIEAKVTSDISHGVSFDLFRNQIARNLDVLMEDPADSDTSLVERNPERTLFALLTPEIFRQNPHTRLYGRLIHEYQNSVAALARDLEHRPVAKLVHLPARIGWLTFEDICREVPGACPWMESTPNTHH